MAPQRPPIPQAWFVRAPRLAVIAAWINANTRYSARIERGYCNTDRKIAGTRLIRPGKGRRGTRLFVFGPNGQKLLDHNAAETYRHNSEVVRWLDEH